MNAPPSMTELLTRQFYDWERRGRGWNVWPEPVDLEPPFRPFFAHSLPRRAVTDDGQYETTLSRLSNLFLGRTAAAQTLPELEDEPEPESAPERDQLVSFQVLVPPDLDTDMEHFEPFLLSLSPCREPVAFEFIGQPGQITIQVTVHPDDASLVRRQFQAFFPQSAFLSAPDVLARAWERLADTETAIVEFGLGHEFMRPLAEVSLDPYVALCGAFSELRENELAVFQVLFAPVRHPWAESVLRAVSDNEGRPFFVNAPELVKEAQCKVSRPLYAAIVRLATQSPDFDGAWQIARNLAGALRVFCDPAGNELIPLTNDRYALADHETDLLRRQSRRSGILLNSEELVGFVHLPSAAVTSPHLERLATKTKRVPPSAQERDGLLLGHNLHFGESVPVWLSAEQRVRHSHLVGATGTGKSTLLFNLIQQDIANGEGIAVLDPHGDLIERILDVIPPSRVEDVVLIDPSDEEFTVGFNILSAHSELEKNLLASDLVSVFERLSSSWGDQMGSVLQNAILAFLESTEGGTLADLRRFLIEPAFRERFLSTVTDPDIVYYWRKGFSQLTGNKSVGPVITRLDTFLAPKALRYMVAQPENRLDFADILDSGKIFLAKLPQGQIGRENAFLLGSLLMAKFQQTVMSRQAQRAALRRDFWLYVDEFHHFITPSLAEILTGARKYRLGLTLAHQELRQLERDKEVASAVLSNCHTRVVFRVGDEDARKLAEGFSLFETSDLQNLATFQAVARVERANQDFNLTVTPPLSASASVREQVIAASRARYGTKRIDVETALRAKLPVEPEPNPKAIARKTAEPEAVKAPKPTGSGKESEVGPVIPVATEIPTKSVPLPADLGRGGAQHQAIQQRLKAAAEALGFRATVELSVLNGDGSVDLALEKSGQTVACEIAITTTIDHEFGNVAKCLKAGFPHVAVVSPKPERLEQIAAAVNAGLGAELAARVGYYSPDDLIAHLQKLSAATPPAQPASTAPAESVSHGYKVRRHTPKLSPEELKAKEAAAMQMIGDALKRKRP
jgi:hypothetical protein